MMARAMSRKKVRWAMVRWTSESKPQSTTGSEVCNRLIPAEGARSGSHGTTGRRESQIRLLWLPALAKLQGAEDESGSEDGMSGTEDEGDDEGEEEEEDEETLEKRAKIRQFNSEIKALEMAIEKKRAGFAGGNPIMMVSLSRIPFSSGHSDIHRALQYLRVQNANVQKRFEETIAGMQADINTKQSSRQALLDNIERNKPQPISIVGSSTGGQGLSAAPKSSTQTPVGATPSGNVDLEDADAEGEDDDTGGAGTPDIARRDGESPASSDEDDDLFGDGDADGEGVGQAGTEGGDTDAEGEGEVEGEMPLHDRNAYRGASDLQASADDDLQEYQDAGEDDEMAAMLRAELGDLAGDNPSNELDQGMTPGMIDEQALHDMAALLPASSPVQDGLDQGDADVVNALDHFVTSGAMEDASAAFSMSSPAYDYSVVEGGVGRRRLAEGAAAGDDDDDDDDDSSDDSD